ncbi:MAG: hypothetical protein HYX67_00175 [Candidatus Melainabacteria bacterium]|nr:hypothetical protein [Candidatus Melainabacteria bacterium]
MKNAVKLAAKSAAPKTALNATTANAAAPAAPVPALITAPALSRLPKITPS